MVRILCADSDSCGDAALNSFLRSNSHTVQFTYLKQRSATSGPQISTSCQFSGDIRLEIKCPINVMSLNHLQSPHIPAYPTFPKSVEKLSSMKPVPGMKKVLGTTDLRYLIQCLLLFTDICSCHYSLRIFSSP